MCRPEVMVGKSLDSRLSLTVVDCNNTVLATEAIPGVFGVTSISSLGHRTQIVSHGANGRVVGNFATSNIDAMNEVLRLADRSGAATVNRRKRSSSEFRQTRQAVVDDIVQTDSISNPLICLQTGEAVFFEINQEVNTSSYHYPVYVKDHRLNSNPNFDYGLFRQLGNLLQTSVNISTFVNVFNDPGIYAFADSIVPSSVTFVIVVEDGTSCERDGEDFRVLPASTFYFKQFGVTRLPTANQQPDFATIFGILATTLFVVCLVVLLMFIWKPKSAGIKTPDALKPVYRRVDEPKVIYVGEDPDNLDTLEKRGVGVGSCVMSSSAVKPLDTFLLENFNIRTLYDKLEDQNLHVSAQLSRQQADLRGFYSRILQQVEGLKSLVSEAQVLSTVETNRTFCAEHLRQSATSTDGQERQGPVGAENPSFLSNSSPLLVSLSAEQEGELITMLKGLLSKTGHSGKGKGKKGDTLKALARKDMIKKRDTEKEIADYELQATADVVEELVNQLFVCVWVCDACIMNIFDTCHYISHTLIFYFFKGGSNQYKHHSGSNTYSLT